MLTADEVARNAQSYLDQFFKIVDERKTEVRRQTEWYDGFDLADVIKLTRKFTVAQLLRRDDFAKRYEGNQPIAVTELLYPLLQAYDSVVVRADIEFGGADQRFNNLLGRELQQIEGQRPQQVLLVPSSSAWTACRRWARAWATTSASPTRRKRCTARRCRSPTS